MQHRVAGYREAFGQVQVAVHQPASLASLDGPGRGRWGRGHDATAGAVQHLTVVYDQVAVGDGVALEGALLYGGVPRVHRGGVLRLHASAVPSHGAVHYVEARGALQVDTAVGVGGEGVLPRRHHAVHVQSRAVDVGPVQVPGAVDRDVVEGIQGGAGGAGQLAVRDVQEAPVLRVDAVLALSPEDAVGDHDVCVDLHEESVGVPLDGGAVYGHVGAGPQLYTVPVPFHPASVYQGVAPHDADAVVAVVDRGHPDEGYVGVLGVHAVVGAVADGGVGDGDGGVVQHQALKAVVHDGALDGGGVGGHEEAQVGVAGGAGVTASGHEGVGDAQGGARADLEVVGPAGGLGGDRGGVVGGGGVPVAVLDDQGPSRLDLYAVLAVVVEVEPQRHVGERERARGGDGQVAVKVDCLVGDDGGVRDDPVTRRRWVGLGGSSRGEKEQCQDGQHRGPYDRV